MDSSQPRLHFEGTANDALWESARASSHLVLIGGPKTNGLTKQVIEKIQKTNRRVASAMRLDLDDPGYRSLSIHGRTWRAAHDESGNVTQDYGVVLLTDNPYDDSSGSSKTKVLLLAGLHSTGTLAAALAVTQPAVAKDIADLVLSNYHLPPHLLNSVFIIVGATPSGATVTQSDIAIADQFIIPPPPSQPLRNVTERLIINLGAACDSGKATRRTIDMGVPLGDEFFKFFTRKTVVVISPHSDDVVLGCGGLLYYLRNGPLWQQRQKPQPSVYTLIVTPSPKGVEVQYIQRYYQARRGLSGGLSSPVDVKSVHDARADDIRQNEALSEASLLGVSDMRWLGANTLEMEEPALNSHLTALLSESPDGAGCVFLIPLLSDSHPTHSRITRATLKLIKTTYRESQVWTYESPWGHVDASEINVLVPLDKHAMFAKCQAMAMHRSQESRTSFADAVRGSNRSRAETSREIVGGFGAGGCGGPAWDYAEVFGWVNAKRPDFSVR